MNQHDTKKLIEIYENFIRATLWSENLQNNNGVSTQAKDKDDAYSEHNKRVMRLRAAAKLLPRHLHDEVSAEDALLYDGMDGWEPDTDAAWKLLVKRGLVVKPSTSVRSMHPQRRTEYANDLYNRAYQAEEIPYEPLNPSSMFLDVVKHPRYR